MIKKHGTAYIAYAFGQRRIYSEFAYAALWIIAVTGKRPIIKEC